MRDRRTVRQVAGIEQRLGAHLTAMLAQMSNRGPDSAGVAVYRDPAPAGSSKLTLFSADPDEPWHALAASSPARSAAATSRASERATPSCSWTPTPRRRRRGCAAAGRELRVMSAGA